MKLIVVCSLILLHCSDLDSLIHVLVGALGSDRGELVEGLIASLGDVVEVVQVSVSSDSSCEVEILLHDGHSLGVDGAQVGVLKETDEVGLSSFLHSEECLGLEPDLIINAFSDGADESLEGSSGHEEGGLLLVSLDLSESDCTGTESEFSGFLLTLDTTLGGGSLLASLGASGLDVGALVA